MYRRLLPTFGCAALIATSWALLAFACEDKATTAQAVTASKSAVCTSAMAAKCTPAQAAACKAKTSNAATAVTASTNGAMCTGKSAAAMTACTNPSTATAAAHTCAGMENTAASAHADCPFAKGAATAGATCPHHTGASAASMAGCEHGAKGAAASMACEHGTKGANYDAAVTGGGKCTGHGMASWADASRHEDCDACVDLARCDAEVKAAGGQTQVVKLKNGVMYVYTAGSPSQVRAVQAAMTRRSDRLTAMTAAGDRTHLCPECKVMRGAMASGKLTREIVSIEGGCLTLMTSNDPTIVTKLHRMMGTEMAARIKS